jgi:hypothetical protein
MPDMTVAARDTRFAVSKEQRAIQQNLRRERAQRLRDALDRISKATTEEEKTAAQDAYLAL